MTARSPSDDGQKYRAANAADKCIRRHYVVCSTAKPSLDFGRLGQVNSSPASTKEDFSGLQNGRSPIATADQCLVRVFCMTCLRRAHCRYAAGLATAFAIIRPRKPVVRADGNEVLAKAVEAHAKFVPSFALQIFKMKSYSFRLVQISREIAAGDRSISAHAKEGVPHIRRKPLDVIAIPRGILRRETAASQRVGLNQKTDDQRAYQCPSSHFDASLLLPCC